VCQLPEYRQVRVVRRPVFRPHLPAARRLFTRPTSRHLRAGLFITAGAIAWAVHQFLT